MGNNNLKVQSLAVEIKHKSCKIKKNTINLLS